MSRIYLSADWRQLEFRLAACYSRDPLMLEACRATDPHQTLATELGIPRKQAKTLNFALLYGAGTPKLRAVFAEELGLDWSFERVDALRNGVIRAYTVLFQYIETVHQQVKRQQWIDTILGHRRWFPELRTALRDRDSFRIEEICRMAWNHQCQGLGHALLDMVLFRLLHHIHDEKLPWYLEADLHDQFLLNIPEADRLPGARLVQSMMESIPPTVLGEWLAVPLPAEILAGPNYGELREIPRQALTRDVTMVESGHSPVNPEG